MAIKLYSDGELKQLADAIVEHLPDVLGNSRDETDIRREVYRTVTALGIANRSAVMLDSRRVAVIERPDLADAEVEGEEIDSLASRAAALIQNCVANSDPLSTSDDEHSFAPALAVVKLVGWATSADGARRRAQAAAR